ncbi:MAG: rhodanese-like domain-containing protein [Deltaproteobacteria bacterium]|nr:rhodanese-like domain-containing protein [Deltaproteobacteria bacterium]
MNRLQKAICQAAAITALAVICALIFNYFRPGGLDLFHFQAPETTDKAEKDRVIPLDMAAALFADKKAMFLDARPASLYAKGHIKGALSLPWAEAEEKFMDIAEKLPEDKTIITYCDGMACDLSTDLADFLRDMGFENVRILINGWSLWEKNKLPMATGGEDNDK